MSIGHASTLRQSYTLWQIVLHWTIAVFVVWQLVFADTLEALEHPAREDATTLFLANSHIVVGIAILVLVLIRIALRLVHGVPPAAELNPLIAGAARAVHAAFYVLLVPVTGILTYFFDLPLGDIHTLGEPLFIALIAVHVLAVLWHSVVRRDGTLRRMLIPAR